MARPLIRCSVAPFLFFSFHFFSLFSLIPPCFLPLPPAPASSSLLKPHRRTAAPPSNEPSGRSAFYRSVPLPFPSIFFIISFSLFLLVLDGDVYLFGGFLCLSWLFLLLILSPFNSFLSMVLNLDLIGLNPEVVSAFLRV